MAALNLGYAIIYFLVSEVYLYGWGPKDIENVNCEAISNDDVSGEGIVGKPEGQPDLEFMDDEEEALLDSATRKPRGERVISTSVLDTPTCSLICSPQNTGTHQDATQDQPPLMRDWLAFTLEKLQNTNKTK